MKRNPAIDVVIPVARPDAHLWALCDALHHQSIKPAHILIINAEEQYWKEEYISGHPEAEVYHIGKEDYVHGTVHNIGAGLVSTEIAVFLSQDVLPYDDRMLSKLIRPMRIEGVQVSYARQIPDRKSGVLDGYELLALFPEEGEIRTAEDIETRGMEAYFSSNLCAAYDMDAFRALDGFPEDLIAAEDILYAAKVLHSGGAVAYSAAAGVYRNLRLDNAECFRKSFDEGAAMAMHPEIVGSAVSFADRSGDASMRELFDEAGLSSYYPRYRMRERIRSLGFSMGMRCRKMPARAVRACSANRRYWSQNKHKTKIN